MPPWAAGKASLHDRLRECRDPDDARVSLPFDLYRVTLSDLANTPGLFAEPVSPVVPDIDKDTDVAGLVESLLWEIDRHPTRPAIIQLYQLLFSDFKVNFGTWPRLSEIFLTTDLGARPTVFALFTEWIREAPDFGPVNSALFALARLSRQPDLDVLLTLAVAPELAPGVARVVAAHFDPSEDYLIHLCKLHSDRFGPRSGVMARLRHVRRAENRSWLLSADFRTVGHSSDPYYAAVHGRLIDQLRRPHVDEEELIRYANIIDLLCRNVGIGSMRSIEDYAEGPEAVALLCRHAGSLGMPEDVRGYLRSILCTIESLPGLESSRSEVHWTADRCAPLAAELRRLFALPHVGETEFYWEHVPSVEDLQSGDLSLLNDVLDRVSSRSGLAEVVAWAIDYLELDSPPAVRVRRRAEVLARPMPGVRFGGLAAFTEDDLGSEYGQIVFQLLRRMREADAPLGWPIVRAGLDSEIRFHRAAAAEVLAGWPEETLPPEAGQMAQWALAAAPEDEEVRSALRRWDSRPAESPPEE
jgi:hypothetical protein